MFLKKIIFGLTAAFLILLGGSGTQSTNLLLQGGGFIGLIIGLVVLYIFMKMAWRAMGCLPSFLVFSAIITFIVYAIGGFNNGILQVGSTLKTFLGQTQNNSSLESSENPPTQIGEDFGPSPIEENQQVKTPTSGGFQQFMSSFGNQKSPQANFNPSNYPAIFSKVKVINGDTLQINGKFLRLYGIDAPEANQTCADKNGRSYACGSKAAKWLKSWLADNTVECRIVEQNEKGNMVGVCAIGPYDIGAALVNAGWAVAYVKYTSIYVPYQEQAQKNGNGLWQGQFYMPWDWRTAQSKKPDIKIIKPKVRRKSILDL